MWLFHAPGSGLWLNVGRVLTIAGPRAEVVHLALSKGQSVQQALALQNSSASAAAAPPPQANEYDTLIFPLRAVPRFDHANGLYGWGGQRFTELVLTRWGDESQYVTSWLGGFRCGPRGALRACDIRDAAIRMQGPMRCGCEMRAQRTAVELLQASSCTRELSNVNEGRHVRQHDPAKAARHAEAEVARLSAAYKLSRASLEGNAHAMVRSAGMPAQQGELQSRLSQLQRDRAMAAKGELPDQDGLRAALTQRSAHTQTRARRTPPPPPPPPRVVVPDGLLNSHGGWWSVTGSALSWLGFANGSTGGMGSSLPRLNRTGPVLQGLLPPSCDPGVRCRTCAVVMSSGAMKGSRLGPSIDAHDFVFRFNLAPTIGFESDVGARTTYDMVMHNAKSQRHPVSPAQRWAEWVRSETRNWSDRQRRNRFGTGLLFNSATNLTLSSWALGVPWLVLPAANCIVKAYHGAKRWHSCSTGHKTVRRLLDEEPRDVFACNVTVFGADGRTFVVDKTHPYHYYDRAMDGRGNEFVDAHSFETEAVTLGLLARERPGLLRIHTPARRTPPPPGFVEPQRPPANQRASNTQLAAR